MAQEEEQRLENAAPTDADDAQPSDRTVCATLTADSSMDDAPTALDARLNEPSTEGGEHASASSSSPASTSSDGISTAARLALAAAGRSAAEEVVQLMTFANQNCRDNNCLNPCCENKECIRTGETA